MVAAGWLLGRPGLRLVLFRSDFGAGLPGRSDDGGLLEFSGFCLTCAARSATCARNAGTCSAVAAIPLLPGNASGRPRTCGRKSPTSALALRATPGVGWQYMLLAGLREMSGEIAAAEAALAAARGVNKGYGREALALLTDWLFEHAAAQAVAASTDPANVAMRTVFQRVGWMPAGSLTEYGRVWIMYRITRREREARRRQRKPPRP